MMPHASDSVQPRLARNSQEKSAGRVFLVGAGPGDPGLLTLRGYECLGSADVVLYDGLANGQLLDFAGAAECISVGKHGKQRIWTQAEINTAIVEHARAGKRVVRLKGGDPAIFARTAEEIDALVKERILFEVVPGITAALAAGSYVGIPLTHRHHASAVALVTGQQQSDTTPQDIDWQALARFPGTLVFYMGVTTVGEWTSKLIAAGKSPETPAAIVRRCSWSDQVVLKCRLGDVAENLTPASKLRPPVITIVGDVCDLGEGAEWFSSRPLHGCGVLVTRAQGQGDSLVANLRAAGADVYCQPAFEILFRDSCEQVRVSIRKLRNREFSGVAFSSVNGVDGLLQNVLNEGLDVRVLAGLKLACVGPATAARLREYGLRCDVQPEHEYSANGLLQALGNDLSGENWLVTATNRSSQALPKGIDERGGGVEVCEVYETRPTTKLRESVTMALDDARIAFVTITSQAVAENLVSALQAYLHQLYPIAISEQVARRLSELSWPAVGVAKTNTEAGLMEAIELAWEQLRTER